ncbi:hypothetical protein MBM_09936 [Drepanopeziza brunnea f. sp. 'multigermtubi' MB_m1]|uniref:Uncharacterized protein n=1 Tax=Marssonina brunnea f. sp. multigermtubi (strain MB_m1) TaxID=1072389 RepID=K1WTJ3_MARBU|nr:uncharacterized protein MBM_09936 [Drepanopeziza brunnea f. sp. 'multigermtubi' MB_m1]EKD11913.1 hypothetical protein MBM_09936 [Drepanopeziza brunnea f. sp. 'multigermtubi' MB_m1]
MPRGAWRPLPSRSPVHSKQSQTVRCGAVRRGPPGDPSIIHHPSSIIHASRLPPGIHPHSWGWFLKGVASSEERADRARRAARAARADRADREKVWLGPSSPGPPVPRRGTAGRRTATLRVSQFLLLPISPISPISPSCPPASKELEASGPLSLHRNPYPAHGCRLSDIVWSSWVLQPYVDSTTTVLDSGELLLSIVMACKGCRDQIPASPTEPAWNSKSDRPFPAEEPLQIPVVPSDGPSVATVYIEHQQDPNDLKSQKCKITAATRRRSGLSDCRSQLPVTKNIVMTHRAANTEPVSLRAVLTGSAVQSIGYAEFGVKRRSRMQANDQVGLNRPTRAISRTERMLAGRRKRPAGVSKTRSTTALAGEQIEVRLPSLHGETGAVVASASINRPESLQSPLEELRPDDSRWSLISDATASNAIIRLMRRLSVIRVCERRVSLEAAESPDRHAEPPLKAECISAIASIAWKGNRPPCPLAVTRHPFPKQQANRRRAWHGHARSWGLDLDLDATCCAGGVIVVPSPTVLDRRPR